MKIQQIVATLVLAWITTTSLAWADNSWKLDETLETWLQEEIEDQRDQSSRAATKKVIVYFKAAPFQDRSGPSVSEAVEAEEMYVEARLMRTWIQIVKSSRPSDFLWSANAIVAKVNRADLSRLKNDSAVLKVIEDQVVTLDQPQAEAKTVQVDESAHTYGLQVVNAPEVWAKGITGQGVRVGILDSGIDFSHPNLKDLVIAHRDFTADGFTDDRNGHGTHVAGTIAGNSEGGTAIGVAPNSKLIIAKIFDDKGSTNLSTILSAMQWMLKAHAPDQPDQLAQVVNNSWGTNIPFILAFADSVRSWRRFGIFPSFAAGNSGPRPVSVGAPGSYSFSFAIGAVDENSAITSFSSRGPSIWLPRWDAEKPRWFQGWWPKLLIKPEVSAPGHNVLSSVPGGELKRFSGTSMATPHVTGVIALLLEANPYLSVEEIEQILTHTAISQGPEENNNVYGHGVVRADVAVDQALSIPGALREGFVDRDPNQWQ
jgi:subtilisin family serine protease